MPDFLLIRPPAKSETESQAKLAAALLDRAARKNWTIRQILRGAVLTSYSPETRGRKINVLTPQDTEIVYRACHVGDDLVVMLTADVRVRQDPRADPAPRRSLLSLEQFVRYKAASVLVRSYPEVEGAFDEAETQLQDLACENFKDPRVLPLHIFAPSTNLDDLADQAGRTRFDRRFGNFARRFDEVKRRWSHGPDHGYKDDLRIARLPLPRGFHWDVNGARSPSSVINGWEVWELRSPRAYVNVSPDGAIRSGLHSVRRWRR